MCCGEGQGLEGEGCHRWLTSLPLPPLAERSVGRCHSFHTESPRFGGEGHDALPHLYESNRPCGWVSVAQVERVGGGAGIIISLSHRRNRSRALNT